MAGELNLTTWIGDRRWVSTGTRFQQNTECLELQFQYGTGGAATYKNTARFYANGMLLVYGELIVQGGQIRSYGTLAMTAYGGSAEDIVSFRNFASSTGQNTERLRITSNGRVKAALSADLELEGAGIEFYADSSGASTLWGLLQFSSGTRQLGATNGTTSQALEIRAASLDLKVGTSTPVSVTIDALANLVAAGYVRPRVTASPTGGSGGDIAADPDNDRIWMKCTTGGWKSVTVA